MFQFSPYAFMVFVHVASAVALVGQSLGAPLIHARVRGARTLAELRLWLDFARQSARWNPPAALVLLGSGLYLGSAGWWRQPWFQVAVAAWLLNTLLAARLVKPAAAALGAAAARAGDGPVPDDMDALRRRKAWAAARVMLANDLAILYVMIDKPSLIQTLVIVALANVAVGWASLGLERAPLPAPAINAAIPSPPSASASPGATRVPGA